MSGEADRARAWLSGQYRTWRWNEGTYAGKNSYHAVETTAEGLVWYGWDVAAGGATGRRTQSYARFRRDGPLIPTPEAVLVELRAWLQAHPR